MTCKKFCIRRIGACIACLVLVINLVCTSYTRVQAAPVAGAYALEEVVAALLVSLGITSATGDALNKAGLTPENARTIINSVYASAKEFSHDTDEIINETIENAVLDAMETGKLIFKQGSQAWNALKAWAKSVGVAIGGLLNPDGDHSCYDMSSVPYNQFVSYLVAAATAMYASYGVSVLSDFSSTITSDYNTKYFADYKYHALLVTEWCGSPKYHVYGIASNTYSDFIKQLDLIRNAQTTTESCEKEWQRWKFASGENNTHCSVDYGKYMMDGKLIDTRILSLSELQTFLWGYLGSQLAMSDAYQTVYNPAIPDTTDVVTPSNTITREKDDSVAVAGDYVIDVALPVAFPVDLTKGIVIDRDIPIEDAIDRSKTDDKTDDKEDDKNKPVIPDVPGTDIGADLTADLKSIFPFCIPFDLIACIKGLVAEGEPPKWVIKIPMPLDYTWTIVVDMAEFDGVVKIFRAGEDILFIVGLIMITRSLMIRG